MIRTLLLLLVTLSACSARQPLRVDCERLLVPINEPTEQIEGARLEAQPQEEGRRK